MIQLLSILVIGLGVGWLAGLTVSPVTAAILASLLGIAGGVVAGARALTRAKSGNATQPGPPQVDARPAAILVLGIALAAPLGILARSYGLFERPGIKPTDASKQGVLFAATARQCQELRAMASLPNENAYRVQVAGSGKWGRLLEGEIKDTAKLKTIVEAICAE